MKSVDKSCLNKMRYETKVQAEIAYKRFKANTPRKRGRRIIKINHEQYPYKCEHCGGWHLARSKKS